MRIVPETVSGTAVTPVPVRYEFMSVNRMTRSNRNAGFPCAVCWKYGPLVASWNAPAARRTTVRGLIAYAMPNRGSNWIGSGSTNPLPRLEKLESSCTTTPLIVHGVVGVMTPHVYPVPGTISPT